MKLIILVLSVLLTASSVLATPPGSQVGPSDTESDNTAETFAIAGSAMFAFGNVAGMVGKAPSYWIGGASIGIGLLTLALSGQDHPPLETGLWISGASAIATGLIAIRYRYVLNQRETHARIVPAWSAGSPALALVIDF